jgi:hypothetical protein
MVNEYLLSFFRALEDLHRRTPGDVSHAIGYEDGTLYTLLSVGDCRLRVAIQELDPDPVKAAEMVVGQFKVMSREEFDRALE